MTRTPRTRSAMKRNQMSEQREVKSDTNGLHEQLTMDKGTKTELSGKSSSSSVARRKQLEFEAAQAKAKLELEAAEVEARAQAALAQTKMRIEKELVDKKLAADIAEMQSQASSLASTRSDKSKVKHWLETSHGSRSNLRHAEQEEYHDSKPVAPSFQPKETTDVERLAVRGPSGVSVHTHALLDDGATVTLVAADIADQLGLSGKPFTMRARSAWGSEVVASSRFDSEVEGRRNQSGTYINRRRTLAAKAVFKDYIIIFSPPSSHQRSCQLQV
ncbi:hypothetical protein ACJJTC_003228 [Scirpophaga incertulas]